MGNIGKVSQGDSIPQTTRFEEFDKVRKSKKVHNAVAKSIRNKRKSNAQIKEMEAQLTKEQKEQLKELEQQMADVEAAKDSAVIRELKPFWMK